MHLTIVRGESVNVKRMSARLLPAVLILIGILSSCRAPAEPARTTGFFFDTVITVTLYNDPDAQEHLNAITALCADYERLLSRTREGSDLYRIAHRREGERDVAVHEETARLLQDALDYAALSEGAFDPTVEPLSALWTRVREEEKLPSPEEVAACLSRVGYERVQILPLYDPDRVWVPSPALAQEASEAGLDERFGAPTHIVLVEEGVSLDLGAIAKGYIADRIKEKLLEDGVTSALIDLGGNLLCVGSKPGGDPFVLGIQKPFAAAGTPAFTLPVTDRSLVTSGIYERYVRIDGTVWHHLIDPATGYPAQNGLSSVTVLSDASEQGDALSTVLFLLGEEKGLALADSLEGVEACFLRTDGTSSMTDGFPAP